MLLVGSLAISALGWVASPIVSRLIAEGFSYVGMNVPKELTELETVVLPQLSLAIKALPSSTDISELKHWLQCLQDVYYEAEDLLDEVEYQRVKQKVQLQNRKLMVRITSHPVIKPLAKFSRYAGSKIPFLYPQKRKFWRQLTKLRETIKKLVEDAKTFRELLQNQLQNVNYMNPNAPIVPVTSSQPLNKVFGRDKDCDHLVQLLLEKPGGASSQQCYSVVAIVGRGGAGKTTLAQYVFNNGRVVGYFDMRIWVCLTRKLDIIEQTKEMIQSATNKDCPQQSSLEALQYDLKKILLGSKNILLVLDDVWHNYNNREVQREEEWERLMAPFNSVDKCSVLLTSRSKEFPVVLHPRYLIDLKDLKEDELISLFRHYSHLDELADSCLQHDLEAIGVEIVAKLGRSPLATKAVAGRFLRIRPNVNVWRDELERVHLSGTTNALMWSFQHLKEPLQRCFLHCSVFPRGFKFTRDHLIRRWRALNFIQSLDTNRDVEDIGVEYVNELVCSFFFEPISNGTSGGLSAYRIHDNFHDLAENLSKGDYYRIEDGMMTKILPTVRHLTIDFSTIEQHAPSISKLKNLRSLVVLKPHLEDLIGVLKEILGNWKKLRLLEVHSYDTEDLPKIVFDFKYLKMLNISWTSVNQLPESLSKLYLLQALEIPNSVTRLPRYMSNLVNLRDLPVYKKYGGLIGTLPPIRDVGKMTSLLELGEFHVRKEIGYEIQQLGELRQLRGDLRISGLENVGHKDEAAKARLTEKTRLKSLALMWNSSWNKRDSDLQVIDGLQPPSNLKALVVDGYAGCRYPVWFESSVVQTLISVDLTRCHLEVLPSNFYSWRNCKLLILRVIIALRELPQLPVNLEKLTISVCPNLVFISEEDLHPNQQRVLLNKQSVISKIAQFMKLARPDHLNSVKEMMFNDLTNFKQISIRRERNFSQEIQVLESCLEKCNTLSFGMDQFEAWWHCHTKRVNFIYSGSVQKNQLKSLLNLRVLELFSCNITDGALSDCLFSLVSLLELRLGNIMSLTTLPSEEILGQLKSLRVLRINSCWLVRSLGALHALSLKKLEVVFCPFLDIDNESNPSSGLPSSLQSLQIILCSISSGTLNSYLPCLEAIEFQSCYSVSTLSIGHLSSLRSLELFDCKDICFLEGIHSLSNLEKLRLTLVPKLEIKDSLLGSWPGCRELHIYDMQLLKLLFSFDALFVPRKLVLEYVDDEDITFDFEGADLHQLRSVESLCLFKCRTKFLPTSLRTTLPSLKTIMFEDCPEISSVPELPKSVTSIQILRCPVLKERCRYNGEEWQKIAHIKWKFVV